VSLSPLSKSSIRLNTIPLLGTCQFSEVSNLLVPIARPKWLPWLNSFQKLNECDDDEDCQTVKCGVTLHMMAFLDCGESLGGTLNVKY